MSLTRGRELLIGARAGLLDPKHVRAMGSARWLYDWILWRVTSEQDGVGRVLGGSPVRCEEIAADLGVGLRTIYRWMDRLRGPYIRTRHVVAHGRHGLTIEVLKSKKFHPGPASETSRISTFSTASTENPARSGNRNPARFVRENPARFGGFHKEYRKPVTESYGKCNSDFLEDLPGAADPRQANPPSPPLPEEERQKQISPACAEASAGERCPGDAEAARDERVERDARNGEGDNAAGQRPGEIRPPDLIGAGNDGGGGAERELLEELRRLIAGEMPARKMPDGKLDAKMLGGKSLAGDGEARRREMLERQKCDLLRRAEGRSVPP
ncbi:MAG TPA: hypothetical protein VNJ12_06770 [Candidatus Dormibacteraeota bacterium]|nr:hypothetical protein [Candidatus Dormibacteraeota bacterium]